MERELARVKEERDYILDREATYKLEVDKREAESNARISDLIHQHRELVELMSTKQGQEEDDRGTLRAIEVEMQELRR